MKVAYVGTFLPQQCGIATYTNYLVTALRKNNPNLKIRIVAENKAKQYQNDFLAVMPVWNRHTDYSEPIIKYTKGFDIIHIQHEFGIYYYDNRLLKTLSGLDKTSKKIATIHCVKSSHASAIKNLEQYLKEIADRLDLIIVHLPSQKSILERLGIKSQKIKVIEHGTEVTNIDQNQARQKLNLPPTSKILLMFGFIKAHKCADIVLTALPKIIAKFPDTFFFLAGGLAPKPTAVDKNYLQLIRNKIDSLNLKKNVIFPNRFFSNQEVPYVLASADIILFPYYETDFSASGAFHLALGAKKPVIATRIPKFEEIKNISEELLILPHNPTELSSLILRLFEDDKFYDYIIQKIDRYRKRTSWQKVAQKHLVLYQQPLTDKAVSKKII